MEATDMAMVLARLSDEDAEKYSGQWVAIKDGKVLFGHHDAQSVVKWVTEHRAEPDLVFRVPAEDDPTDWSL
jgi:hypothetical protein